MRYPIAIEPGDKDSAFGVVVPDLPGCFSTGDTLDEAVRNAAEAISLWIECVLDDGGAVPHPAPLQTHRDNPDFEGWIWALVDIDSVLLSEEPEQINITLPARLVRRIDDYANAHQETRSGFLARAAIGAMRPE